MRALVRAGIACAGSIAVVLVLPFIFKTFQAVCVSEFVCACVRVCTCKELRGGGGGAHLRDVSSPTHNRRVDMTCRIIPPRIGECFMEFSRNEKRRGGGGVIEPLPVLEMNFFEIIEPVQITGSK